MRKIIFSFVVFAVVDSGITASNTADKVNSPSKVKNGSKQSIASEDGNVTNLLKYVNPLLGTQSGEKGRVAPLAGVPFGMTSWTPATSPPDKRCTSPYYNDDKKIQGIRNLHWPNRSCT